MKIKVSIVALVVVLIILIADIVGLHAFIDIINKRMDEFATAHTELESSIRKTNDRTMIFSDCKVDGDYTICWGDKALSVKEGLLMLMKHEGLGFNRIEPEESSYVISDTQPKWKLKCEKGCGINNGSQ